MVEAVLEIALEKLSSLVTKEVGLFLSFDQNLKRLASLLTTIKATLEDAEERQFSDRAIKDWLQKLKVAAYVLDDIVDECAYETLRLEYQGINCGPSHKVQTSCLSSLHPKHLVFRYKFAKKMERISERLEEIAGERTKFHLTERVSERRAGVIEWRQTSSIINQQQVYGREEDKDKIVDFLVSDASQFQDLSVYSIRGLGGLGKTTLAQLIFNHERVVNHFEPRIWVCVSEDFSLKRMTKAIIEAVSGEACGDLYLEPLQRKLQDLLQGKRYLLVLDDVWDDDQENWRRLKSVLASGAKGASILVTTRLQTVASIMGTTSPCELSQLSDKDCWKLFKERAFEPNEVEREELVVIGKEIVDKCGGVPLAAIALGSLLRFKREEKEWLYVKESKLWNLRDENLVMPALRLSYLNLPIKLRQCFAFCAIFPKDEIIRKEFLVELWMANGFISSNDMLDAEEIGDDVWKELYWRSFFQDIKKDDCGKVTSFKMHDLVHDLAQSVSEEVCCITNDHGVTTVSERIRHLSDYRRYIIDGAHHQLARVKSLKTFIEKAYDDDGRHSAHLLKCYSLRVLDFGRQIKLSSSIGHLKHLRYLNLSWGRFETLPESLCRLWNLQILNLYFCYRLLKLPNSLIGLKALQHLSLEYCSRLSSLPPQIGKLTSLRNLSMYFAGNERGFLLAELGGLKLKGDLHIMNLENVISVADARAANMSGKQLSKLELSWDRNGESQVQENVEQILEVLQPQLQQLHTLWVHGYKGARFPQWMSSPSLKHLSDLALVDCNNCLQLPQLGKLPSLKRLKISNMIHIKYLYEESHDGGVFNALESLSLDCLPNLERLSREEGENMFPHLSQFQITDYPDLSGGFQFLTSLERLTIERSSEVEGLHDALQHMTALRSLKLSDLPNLKSLPDSLGNLGLLQELAIYRCPKLRFLPTSIQRLNGLKRLEIAGCPELEKRCQKETGEDWPKIAHVSKIYIADRWV